MGRPGSEHERTSEGEVRKPDIAEAFRDGKGIDRALRRAVHEALGTHKIFGNPIAVGMNERVVWVPPEQIPFDDGMRRPPPR